MKKIIEIIVLLSFLNTIQCFDLDSLLQYPPDTFYNVTEMITSKGYPAENYIAQTKDGYLLSIQRIPYGRQGSGSTGQKPVVLLVHGAVGDTNTFVLNFGDQSLGFALADRGYDVWMGNLRGNKYSKRNVRLSPEQAEFWDISLDHRALIDLPTMIDYVLSKTGKSSLSFVGYSEATTLMFALLSTIPEYNQKVNLFASYAPVIYTKHMHGLLAIALRLFILLEPIYEDIGLYSLLEHGELFELVAKYICGTPLRPLCDLLYYGIFGYDPLNYNKTRVPLYLNQYPGGEPTKCVIHYSQIYYSGVFRMYDYRDRNQEYYNQPTPPVYDLSKITAPVLLLIGLNDIDATPFDADKIIKQLKTEVIYYSPKYPYANHGDYILGINAFSLYHDPLIQNIKKYNIN